MPYRSLNFSKNNIAMKGEMMDIKVGEESVAAYLAHPEHANAPAAIVIHEVWGLTENIKDIANRFAAEGFLALAPDLITGSGAENKVGMEIMRELGDPATRDEAQKKMRAALAPISTPDFGAATVAKLAACYEFLQGHEESNRAVGVVGFCFGGTYAYALAAAEPALAFAIAFYGQPPQAERIPGIQAPLLAFYGEKDVNLMKTLPELEAAMKANGKQFKAIVYPNVGHAFFNDKNPVTYNAEAAAKAWEEVKLFLNPFRAII